jgi:hypothetical protein
MVDISIGSSDTVTLAGETKSPANIVLTPGAMGSRELPSTVTDEGFELSSILLIKGRMSTENSGPWLG